MSIATEEHDSRRQGPEAALHRGRVARRLGRRDARGDRSRHRGAALRGGRRHARGRRRGARRRRRHAGRVGRHAAQRPRRDPLEGVRAADGARRRAGRADDARDGQAGRRVEGRDRLRGGLLPLVLRRGAAHRRQLQAVRQRHQPRARDEAAGRAEPDDHALELPDGDGHAQGRARRSPRAARS